MPRDRLVEQFASMLNGDSRVLHTWGGGVRLLHGGRHTAYEDVAKFFMSVKTDPHRILSKRERGHSFLTLEGLERFEKPLKKYVLRLHERHYNANNGFVWPPDPWWDFRTQVREFWERIETGTLRRIKFHRRKANEAMEQRAKYIEDQETCGNSYDHLVRHCNVEAQSHTNRADYLEEQRAEIFGTGEEDQEAAA